MRVLGLLAGAEGITQWVTRNPTRLGARSIPNSASSSGGATVTSDAGLLLPRELDERLGPGGFDETSGETHSPQNEEVVS